VIAGGAVVYGAALLAFGLGPEERQLLKKLTSRLRSGAGPSP